MKQVVESLRMIKSLQYVFEVDSRQTINKSDMLYQQQGNRMSLVPFFKPLINKYKQFNEKNIEKEMNMMMMPMMDALFAKQTDLKLKNNSSDNVPSSVASSASTYLSTG